MDKERNTGLYLQKIAEDIEFLIENLNNKTLADFENDELLNSAVSFKFIQISENEKKLPQSILMEYDDIPWNKISGLRNKIVHEYGNVKLEILYETVKDNLPDLLEKLKNIIK